MDKCDIYNAPCACGSFHKPGDGTFGQPGMWGGVRNGLIREHTAAESVEQFAKEQSSKLDAAERDGTAGRLYAEGVAEAAMERWEQAEERAKELERRLDSAESLLSRLLKWYDTYRGEDLPNLFFILDAIKKRAVERRCSFAAEVLAEGVPSPCILREGHKGRHELDPGHYIHDDAREPLCEDCPPKGYPTDETRCLPCPRRVHG